MYKGHRPPHFFVGYEHNMFVMDLLLHKHLFAAVPSKSARSLGVMQDAHLDIKAAQLWLTDVQCF